jgi:hypothetical protein
MLFAQMARSQFGSSPESGLLIALVNSLIIFPLSLAFGAIILRSACQWMKLPIPGFLRAMGIFFAASVASYLALLAVVFAFAVMTTMCKFIPLHGQIAALAIGMIEAFLVTAGLYVPLLKIDFPTTLQLTGCQLLLTILIAIVLWMIALVFMSTLMLLTSSRGLF